MQITYRDLRQELSQYIGSGEQIEWYGEPRKGIYLKPSDGIMIPFSLLWGGFAIFWETLVLSFDAPIIFPIFGIPFVLVGIYLIIGRFFVDAVVRRKTVYGITNKRILIKSGLFTQTIKSMNFSTLIEPTLAIHKNGRGTITFNNAVDIANDIRAGKLKRLNSTQKTMFEQIENPQSVYNRIIDNQRKAWKDVAELSEQSRY